MNVSIVPVCDLQVKIRNKLFKRTKNMNANEQFITYADIVRPSEKIMAFIYDLVLVITGSIIIALSAKIRFYLPFSPVPVTGQTFTVLLIGALYGYKKGMLTVIAYLAEGLAGFPVFAGGFSGIAYLAGPTGGYLAGFIAAAGVTGFFARRGWDRKLFTTALAMTAGSAVMYIFGLSWLYLFAGTKVITVGLIPFISGDILKITLAAMLLPSGWKFVGKEN